MHGNQTQGVGWGSVDTTLLNVGLAEPVKPGFIIAFRVLFLPEFSMARGVIFLFASGKEQRLMRSWWKKEGLERYSHFFRMSRKETFQAILDRWYLYSGFDGNFGGLGLHPLQPTWGCKPEPAEFLNSV